MADHVAFHLRQDQIASARDTTKWHSSRIWPPQNGARAQSPDLGAPKNWLYCYTWLVVWNMSFIFPYIGNNHPNWLIFFRGVQTTNQYTQFMAIWKTVFLQTMSFSPHEFYSILRASLRCWMVPPFYIMIDELVCIFVSIICSIEFLMNSQILVLFNQRSIRIADHQLDDGWPERAEEHVTLVLLEVVHKQ